jgi:hypothetical protein
MFVARIASSLGLMSVCLQVTRNSIVRGHYFRTLLRNLRALSSTDNDRLTYIIALKVLCLNPFGPLKPKLV